MKLFADLHVHSKHSRATSKEITIENLEKYAKVKGVNLLGTGDFTHPVWLNELRGKLKDNGNGIFLTKNKFPFILTGEISLIYTQDGKGRKIHNVILAPDFEIVEQINEALLKKGRLDYDGRPIFGMNCVEFVEMMKEISEDIEVIPAHCLLPGTYIHCNPENKKIEEIKEKERVLTHNGKFKGVLKTYKRFYKGKVYKIVPWYFREGETTTSEHPFFAVKSFKNCSWIKGTCKPLCSQRKQCKKRHYQSYTPEWVQAKDLEKGDFILYPRTKKVIDKDKINVSSIVKNFFAIKKYGRTKDIQENLSINKEFCRLAGYYVAEGYTIGNEAIAFSFHKDEKAYIQDVVGLMKSIFGIHPTKFDERKGTDIIFYSQILNTFFKKLFYSGKEKRAWNKSLPEFMLYLPREKQTELLRGWWRGDAGYTVSHKLANQMKLVCIRLGIIPSVSRDFAEDFNRRGKHFIYGRKISTNRDVLIFSNLSFFENKELLKDKCFRKFINRRNRKHGWVDENYIYLPIKKIETKDYDGRVYNLEVDEDNSYVTENATLHNCWTPWFSLFGSMSGFDSLEECYKEQAKHIFALETGLSSNPEMNWRVSALDKYSLVSFSDSHSFWPWRIGREATIFDIEVSYKNIITALRTKKGLAGTIEVDPNYGKYHFDGHRNCNVSMSPPEAKRHNNICPVCRRPLTIGVLHRVEELADREGGFKPKGAVPFYSLIPLSEILAKLLDSGIATQKTWKEYNNLIANFGSEFNVLLNAKLEDLKKFTDAKIAEKIIENREGKIKIIPGYDGEYGYPVFDEKDIKKEEIKKPEQKGLGEFFRN